jgi:predicted amidohydrolase YtcJ
MRQSRCLLVGLLLAGCDRPTADLVLLDGRILTVDSTDRVAEAVAITGTTISAVGTTAEIRRLIGPRTDTILLAGRAVTPGLLDGHSHFVLGAVDRKLTLDLSYPAVKSVAEIVAKVRAEVGRRKTGEWITGRGWDEGKLTELRYVTAADLDAVAPSNPVWLTHTMGHYGTANSAAMALARIDRTTKDPPGGTIDHDPRGSPTGVLKESAQRLVTRLIPDATPEQTREAIAELARDFNAEGMTGLKDPGIGEETWEAYRQVLADGKLSVRVFALWRPAQTDSAARDFIARRAATTRPYESTGDDHLISGGIKLMIDGSGGARTAWLHQEWNKNRTEIDRGNYGYPSTNPDTLRAIFRLYHDAGLHVSIHSIGDRAIDWTVRSYADALARKPTKGLRHGIIHGNIPTDSAIAKIAELERTYDAAYPEPSATFMWWIGDTYAGNFGPERSLRLNPFATFKNHGIIWADGSDFPVTPFPGRHGVWASVARQTLLGVYGQNPWGMAEAVDVKTALRSRTLWVARQMFLEEKIGSIEVGKYADLAVWDRDPYAGSTANLADLRADLTIFDGKVVYRRSP